ARSRQTRSRLWFPRATPQRTRIRPVPSNARRAALRFDDRALVRAVRRRVETVRATTRAKPSPVTVLRCGFVTTYPGAPQAPSRYAAERLRYRDRLRYRTMRSVRTTALACCRLSSRIPTAYRGW